MTDAPTRTHRPLSRERRKGVAALAVRSFLAIAILIGLVGWMPSGVAPVSAQTVDRYIVTLHDSETNPNAAAAALAKQHWLQVSNVYEVVLKGFAATVPAAALNGLMNNPRVKTVELDLPVSIFATVPKGIDRVGGEDVGGTGKPAGAGKTVAVLDTGVAAHPDLNIAAGYNCTTSDTTAYGDVHSHGTHVAGTIGANGTIIGVAPGTPILAVKVLGDNGSGSWSSVLCGIDWVAGAGNGGVPRAYVANLSLGASSNENANSCSSSSLHLGICNAAAKGIQFAVAAGNSNADASGFVPAKYPEVITVAALADSDGCAGGFGPSTGFGADDTRASFSNYGSVVDIAAPGANIYSTVPGGYGTKSGTSMAAPHVAGMLALGGYATTPSSFGIPVGVVPNGDISCAGAAPNTTITASPTANTSQTSASFSFSATTSSTFECKLDTGAWDGCGGPATTGTKSYTGLAQGSHTFSVRAKANGATDSTPATFSWVIDTTAPSGSITSPAASAVVSGSVNVVASATDAGSGVASVQFQVAAGAGAFTNLGSADTTSPFEIAWTTGALINGAYSLRAVITDKAGNATNTAAVSVTVSNAADTFIGSAPAGLVASSSATVTFSSNDPAATFDCSVDSGAFTACASPLSLSGLADGAHSVAVRAVNAGGADSTPASASWTVDTIAPTASVSAPAATLSGAVTISATSSDANGIASIDIQVSTSGSGAWSSLGSRAAATHSVTWNTATVGNGAYDLRAVAIDAAGFQGISPVVTVTVNNVVAAISVNPTSGKSGSTVTITGSGFGAGETVTIYWDKVSGKGLASVRANSNGEFSVTVKVPTRQTLGDHLFIARGGSSGNQATATFRVI
jgi:subtilisin